MNRAVYRLVVGLLLTLCSAASVAGEKKLPRTDLYGDPLPPGAVARLGTHRLRHLWEINSVGYAPDGKTIASADGTGVVAIWDAVTGKRRHMFLDHSPGASAVAFSPDGKTLASGGGGGKVVLRATTTGKTLAELQHKVKIVLVHTWFGGKRGTWKKHTEEIRQLAFSPDGKTLLAVSGGAIHLWNIRTRTNKLVIEHPGVVSALFAPDGKTIASASPSGLDHHVRLWDTATGRKIRSLEAPKVSAIAFSPDGNALAAACIGPDNKGFATRDAVVSPAVGTQDGVARVWDVKSGRSLLERRFRPGPGSWTRACVAFSPNAKLLALGGSGYLGGGNVSVNPYRSEYGVIRIWQMTTGKKAIRYKGHPGGVRSLAFSPDGKRLASGGEDRKVRQWDTATGKEIVIVKTHFDEVRSAAVFPDGVTVATASLDGTARLWDAITGAERRVLRVPKGDIRCVAVSPSGQSVATGGTDRLVRLWNTSTGKVLHTLKGHGAIIWSLAFSPDGKMLASVGGSGYRVRLWDVARVKPEQVRKLDRAHCWGVMAFSPDGKVLATGALNEPRIGLWDPVTGTKTAGFGDGDPVTSLAFCPKYPLLASGFGRVGLARRRAKHETAGRRGGRPYACALWDPKTGKRLANLGGHTDEVWSVAFSPDGVLLASASGDGSVRLWDVLTRKGVATLTGHGWRSSEGALGASINIVAFSSDGEFIVSGGVDGTTLVWSLEAIMGHVRSISKTETLDSLWTDLAAREGLKGYRAYRTMVGRGREAVKFIAERLKPVPADPTRIKQCIAELGADKYATRRKAEDELARFGLFAEPALREALKTKIPLEAAKRIKFLLAACTGPSPLTDDIRRESRAVTVLERLGTARCRQVLADLAKGNAWTIATKLAAKAALQRLTRRKQNQHSP